MSVRLQKLIAQCGITSRRQAEEWIRQGRVTLNNQLAVIGQSADLTVDQVRIDGKLLCAEQPKVVLLLNKPRGYVCTLKDPQGRPLVTDLVKDEQVRLFPVGRLDFNTEGLLLLTNDGDLAFALSHPARRVDKTYLVKTRGLLTPAMADRLRRGVQLDDGMTAPAKIDYIRPSGSNCWFEMTIHEGKNRQVRRMCEFLGLVVIRLKRIRIGPLAQGDLPSGRYRYLQPAEIARLKN